MGGMSIVPFKDCASAARQMVSLLSTSGEYSFLQRLSGILDLDIIPEKQTPPDPWLFLETPDPVLSLEMWRMFRRDPWLSKCTAGSPFPCATIYVSTVH
jgi:hypothetical protein